MKNIITILVLLLSISTNAQVKLEKLWETKNLPTPESVLPDGNWLYVSLIDGGASEVDFKGGIALLNQSGMVVNKEWIKGLNAPKGMGIYKDIMYVADINRVIKIDVKTARILERIDIDGAVFLNDITIDAKGNVFVSDTRLNQIYRIVKDKPELYLENIEKEILLNALNLTHWNRTLAAKKLGMTFRSLRYRLKKFGLDTEDDE